MKLLGNPYYHYYGGAAGFYFDPDENQWYQLGQDWSRDAWEDREKIEAPYTRDLLTDFAGDEVMDRHHPNRAKAWCMPHQTDEYDWILSTIG